jgi:hypothetical protein
MANLNYDDLMEVFTNLKKSINDFHSENEHLETSGVFSMNAIMKSCEKMEALLNCDFEYLWKLERQDVKELREKLENIPVEIVKHKNEEDYSDMPPLIPLQNTIPSESCGLGCKCVSENLIQESVIQDTTNQEFCYFEPDTKSVNSEPRPNQNVPLPTSLKSSIWSWPASYNPISSSIYNNQLR